MTIGKIDGDFKRNKQQGLKTCKKRHVPITPDNDYEFGFSQSVPGVTQTNLYARFNGLKLNNGIVLGSAEMGMTKVGGDYQYFEWEVNTLQGKARAGITTEYVGAELGASLFSAEGGFKMPLPLTDKSLYIGGSGELFGVGLATYYSNGKLKLKVSALIGGGITLGIEQVNIYENHQKNEFNKIRLSNCK